MDEAAFLPAILGPQDHLVMVVGSYGSGKTEVTVNLALDLARAGRRVQVADLDLVNPYFRSREASRLLEDQGIRVVIPPGAQAFADLPIVLPEIRGMLRPPAGTVTLFDVGGDDVGARVLSSFRPSLQDGAYQLWQVVNANRPFTQDVAGCHAMRHALEAATRLRVTGLVGNTHLLEETTVAAVLDGWRLAEQVGREAGLPVRFVAVPRALADAPALEAIPVPRLTLDRRMLPPWLRPTASGEPTPTPRRVLPAARPLPIGKPRPL